MICCIEKTCFAFKFKHMDNIIICYIENAGLALDNYKIEKIVQLYAFKTSDYS